MATIPPRAGSDIVEVIKGLSDQVAVVSKTDTTGTIFDDDGTVVVVADNLTYYQTNVIVSSVAPTGLNQSTQVASVWYDTSTDPYTIKWWDGFGFQTYTPGQNYHGGTGLDALAPAVLSRIQTNLRLYYRATAPGSPITNWLWKDSDDNKVYRWNGSTWIEILDVNILTAVTAALTATGTNLTDEYITVYYQATAPSGQNSTTDKGNLWFETDEGLRPFRWDGTAWTTYEGDVRETPSGTDGAPPPYSPTPTVIPVFGGYFVTFAEVPNADATMYDVFASTTTPVPIIASNMLESTAGTFVASYTKPDKTPYIDGTTYYFAVIARDPDGLATVSASVAGGTVKQQIVRTQITDNAIDTPQLNTNAVTAQIVASNAVYTAALQTDSVKSDKVDALAITVKHTLTGPVLQTASGGERVIVRNDGSGGIIEFFTGIAGETPGYIDPTIIASGTRPGIKIQAGTTDTWYNPASISITAGNASGTTRTVDITADVVDAQGALIRSDGLWTDTLAADSGSSIEVLSRLAMNDQRITGIGNMRMGSGSISGFSGSAGADGPRTATVNFPAGSNFAGQPNVVVVLNVSGPQNWAAPGVTSISTSGFVLNVSRLGGSTTSVTYFWIAMDV